MTSTRAQPKVELRLEQTAVSDLVPDANPRAIDGGELEALTHSIQQFGFVDPVIARRVGRRVIAGHQRLVVARRLGLATVPVIFLDCTADQARLLNLALNRIQGDWDQELLTRLLADLQGTTDADLRLTGFADDEVRRLLRTLDAREKRDRPETFDLDATLDAIDQAACGTQRGDTWQMGPHRVMCGDATDAANVAQRLDGSSVAMAFTDPPYNVAYGDHGGQGRGQRKRRLKNDAVSPEEWDTFCTAWTVQLVQHVAGALYICMSTKEWRGHAIDSLDGVSGEKSLQDERDAVLIILGCPITGRFNDFRRGVPHCKPVAARHQQIDVAEVITERQSCAPSLLARQNLGDAAVLSHTGCDDREVCAIRMGNDAHCPGKLSPDDLFGDAHWLPESIDGDPCHGPLKRMGQREDHVRRCAILLPQRVRRQLLVTTEVPAVEIGD